MTGYVRSQRLESDEVVMKAVREVIDAEDLKNNNHRGARHKLQGARQYSPEQDQDSGWSVVREVTQKEVRQLMTSEGQMEQPTSLLTIMMKIMFISL